MKCHQDDSSLKLPWGWPYWEMNPSTWNLYGWAFQKSKNPVQKYLCSSVPRFRLQEYLLFFPQPILKKNIHTFHMFVSRGVSLGVSGHPGSRLLPLIQLSEGDPNLGCDPSGLRGETQQNKQMLALWDSWLREFYILPKSEDVNKRITFITRSEPTFFSVF